MENYRVVLEYHLLTEAIVFDITWDLHFVIYINVSYCDVEIVYDYDTFRLR